MSEEGTIVHHHHHSHSTNDSFSPPPPPPPQQYGTFEGIPPSTPPEVDFGRVIHHHHRRDNDYDYNPFPPPLPPGSGARFPYAYQTVPGYAVAQGTPITEYHRPCCGQGVGGCLFLIFFSAVVIWMLAQLL